MVGRHPELYAFPELMLFSADTVREQLESDHHLVEAGIRPFYRSGIYRSLAQLHEGVQSDRAIADAVEWFDARRTWSGADVFDHLLGLVAPAVGIEKSPVTSDSRDNLERVAAAYPRGRFLHLTRHPRTTIDSMIGHFGPIITHVATQQTTDPRSALEQLPRRSATVWFTTHRRIADFCEALPPERTLRVRAEDVLNDPAATLPRITGWLGVRDDPDALEAMLEPGRSDYENLGPETAPGGFDPSFLADPAPRRVVEPDRVDLPREWGIGAELGVSVPVLAARLGYSLG